MTQPNNSSLDSDRAVRERILRRAKSLAAEVAERIAMALGDLDTGHHRAALGALDGIETQLTRIRSVLLLLEED